MMYGYTNSDCHLRKIEVVHKNVCSFTSLKPKIVWVRNNVSQPPEQLLCSILADSIPSVIYEPIYVGANSLQRRGYDEGRTCQYAWTARKILRFVSASVCTVK